MDATSHTVPMPSQPVHNMFHHLNAPTWVTSKRCLARRCLMFHVPDLIKADRYLDIVNVGHAK
ncbi:hypothetical protein SESBI_50503 [Sesbania bispinosa]|nr:hypothetical protein SESBI_50503 [Sesbania bispinosa]